MNNFVFSLAAILIIVFLATLDDRNGPGPLAGA